MSDSTSLIQQIVAGANADVRINENFDAASPSMLFGRRAATTTGLTWGYYGGRWSGIAVASGTVTLGASTTTYLSILRSTGVLSASTATTNWNNTELYARAYKIVSGVSTITSYEDHRAGAFGTYTGYITASEVANTPAGNIAATNMQAAINELDAEKEALSNKATTFGTVNDTLYPSVQAVKTYADSLVLGLWDDRGSYNASVNTYPTSGGSGAAGAVMKGDIWTVSVAGTLGGVAVAIGDSVRALIDTPAQTAANWAVLESNTGYVPENVANKDASGGYVGLTLFKLNLRNAANTVTSWFTTAATAARTWTLPDYDGTLATLAGTETLTNKTLTSPTMTAPVLGTPASGTVTNLTGTASININGTVGATTPAAGSFTTVSATGLIDLSAAGAGQIKFPATQVASANANTLDDYEEGTFTPVIEGTTVVGAGTYTFQNGRYTKIGRLVHVTLSIAWVAHTGTGNIRISGLPFTSLNASQLEWPCVPEFANMTMPASTIPFAVVVSNSANIHAYSQTVGAGNVTALAMDTAANIYLTVTYEAT